MSTTRTRSVCCALLCLLFSFLAASVAAAAAPTSSRDVNKRAPQPPIESAGIVVGCPGGCDDSDACTTDSCVENDCVHDPIDCGDGDVCNGEETCDPLEGCLSGGALDCEDYDSCTSETCDAAQGCLYTLTDQDWDHYCEVDNCWGTYNPDQSDSDKDGIGDACEVFRVDFAPSASEIDEDSVGDDGSSFVSWRGWGWSSPVGTREREQELPQWLDTFAFSRDERHWTLQLPNGDYYVYVVSGDASFPQGPHRVSTQGQNLIDDEMTDEYAFAEGQTYVQVRNGRLDVAIGGTNGNTMLNLAEVGRIKPSVSFLRSINFQDDVDYAPIGFESDFGEPFDGFLGYGWGEGEHEGVVQDNESTPYVLDSFVRVTGFDTWEVAVPYPGYYEVWLSAGDALSAAGPHRVIVEGNPVLLSEFTSTGEFLERHAGAFVDDGFLTLEVGHQEDSVSLGDEPQQETDLNYVVVASTSEDADNDGVMNDVDLCPFVSDEGQDGDKDGTGDACDADRDNDGAENPWDVCPDQWDPWQFDEDGDGLGDGCEACPSDPSNDPDGDGVCHLDDNCPDVLNPDQEDFDRDGLGDACTVLLIDFAPVTSPPGEGYRLDHGAAFDPVLGKGWNKAVASRDRHAELPQEMNTFVFSMDSRTWVAEVPNGDYSVGLLIGDASYAQGAQRVVVQDQVVFEDHYLSAGQFDLGVLSVEVRNGRLELEIGYDLSVLAGATSSTDASAEGDDASMTSVTLTPEDGTGLVDPSGFVYGFTTIDWLEAYPEGEPEGVFRSFNFQPASSVIPPGAEVDSGEPFSLGTGYGWSASVQTRERGRSVPQVLDTFAFTSAPRTWEVDVPNGFYRVFASVGDARYQQGPQVVTVEGSPLVNGESTDAGSFIERDTVVLVLDGRLTLEVGGGGGNTCLNYVTIQTFELELPE